MNVLEMVVKEMPVIDYHCPKIGYRHSINHCPCNPNYGKEKYCQSCFTALMPFKLTKDWEGRQYHKKCWKKLVDEGKYECEECGYNCNDFLQDFCDCDNGEFVE